MKNSLKITAMALLLSCDFAVFSYERQDSESLKVEDLSWTLTRVENENSVQGFCIYTIKGKKIGFGLVRSYGDLVLLKIKNEDQDIFTYNLITDSNNNVIGSDSITTTNFDVIETSLDFQKELSGIGKVSSQITEESGLTFGNWELWSYSWQGLSTSLSITPRLDRIENNQICDPTHHID